MRVCQTDVEMIKGNGENLDVAAVAVESVEDYPIAGGEILSVFKGVGHYYTIVASMAFDQTEQDAEHVRQGYADVLNKALELGVTSLALIPFGYEKGVISPSASAKVLAQELLKFLRFKKHGIEKIFICVADAEHFDIFEKNFIGYMTHVQNTLGMGPYVTVDAIVELPQGIVVVKRSNPPFGWALPGGFVDYGESLETAVVREVQEETGLEFVAYRQFKTCSDPARDPRFHTVSTVFIGQGKGAPQAGDDAASLQVLADQELLHYSFVFDHQQVIAEYLRMKSV